MNSTRVVHYPKDCLCGAHACYTGCADLRLAPPRCRRNLRANEHNVFVVEETGGHLDDGCTRAERAHAVAQVGARSLVIVAPPNATNLLDGVNSQDVSAAVETLLYLEHVAMPVGVMEYKQGQLLMGYVRDAEKADLVPQVKLDFTHEEHGEVVHVNIWHDTDDACGVLCHDVHAFFADLAATVASFTDSTPINFVPRFLYESCTGADAASERCQRGCVNDSKYCTLRGSRSAQAPGAMVTQENVRQACLYDALRGNAFNLRQFWTYKTLFQDNCKSAEGTFNAECSAEQFQRLRLLDAEAVLERWQACMAPLNNGAMSIPIADADITGREGHKVSNALQATVVTVLPEPAVSHHYRGDLSAVHVMKAACSALEGPQRAKVQNCRRLSQGKCAPGADGDIACKSITNRNRRRTQCVDSTALLGYECQCSPGYVELSDEDGRRTCEDRNECVEYPELCGRLLDPRAACENLPGSFQCKPVLEQQCSEERGWGGCWTGEANNRFYSSCEDLVDEARANLEQALPQGALSRCSCEAMPGCWTGGTGTCVERCPLDRCDINTQQCSADASETVSVGGAIGISLAVIAAAAAAAAVVVMVYRRRRDHDPATNGTTNFSMRHDTAPAGAAPSGSVAMYVAGAAAASDGTVGSGALHAGADAPPAQGSWEGERPPTFGAQNSFMGSGGLFTRPGEEPDGTVAADPQ